MKTVLPSIISPEQTGFMASRNICENLRKTLETIEYANKSKKAVSIDFEKCFDHVVHSSVLKALSFFGFGEKYISLVSVFIRILKFAHKILVFIRINKQRKRGEPGLPNFSSPFCYLVIGELTAMKIKESHKIEVFKNSPQYKNDNIVICALAVPFEI